MGSVVIKKLSDSGDLGGQVTGIVKKWYVVGTGAFRRIGRNASNLSSV